MPTLTKKNLLWFINYAVDKGLVNTNTGGSWRAAVTKILDTYGPDDDLSSVDVPSETLKFNNRNPGDLSPDSLRAYQQRAALALAEFTKYQADPTKYQGVLTRSPISKNGSKPSRAIKASEKQVHRAGPGPSHASARDFEVIDVQPKPPVTSAVTETSLMMPFPLRPSFLAQIIIPRDMTRDEAARLCTFITSLGHE